MQREKEKDRTKQSIDALPWESLMKVGITQDAKRGGSGAEGERAPKNCCYSVGKTQGQSAGKKKDHQSQKRGLVIPGEEGKNTQRSLPETRARSLFFIKKKGFGKGRRLRERGFIFKKRKSPSRNHIFWSQMHHIEGGVNGFNTVTAIGRLTFAIKKAFFFKGVTAPIRKDGQKGAFRTFLAANLGGKTKTWTHLGEGQGTTLPSKL